jgi:hypothetical protein
MRRGENGIRNFGGRYFILGNRGPKAEMQREAASRKATHYVRVVPWNPFYSKALKDLLDDWALYVFPRNPR